MLITIIIQQENLPDIAAIKIVERILPYHINGDKNIDISSFHIKHDYKKTTEYIAGKTNIINIVQNTHSTIKPSFMAESCVILAMSKPDKTNNIKIKTLKSRLFNINSLPIFDYHEIMLGYIFENI